MAQAVVRVEGLNRLRSTMRKASLDMTQLRDLNRGAASRVAGVARGTAPRRSGRLAASVRASASQRAGTVRAGRKSIPYAGVIHWGWPKRNIKAQPWLVDAAKASEPAWIEDYLRGVEKMLDQVEGK